MHKIDNLIPTDILLSLLIKKLIIVMFNQRINVGIAYLIKLSAQYLYLYLYLLIVVFIAMLIQW